MFSDGKLNALDARLEQFTLRNSSHQDELQAIVQEYNQLLDDYKSLRDAYEGTRGNGFNGDSSLQPRNPYILVLVDGNGYIFNDELIRDKEEGGMRAARMLNEAIEKYIKESLPQARDARIVVRLYADVTNLSKQLAKSKLTGLEKRSLAPFTAGFTRAINFFDFTDALDEEGTKFKIRENFKVAVEDDACMHILYAACQDSGYYSQLVPYTGHRSKVTLVQGAGFVSDFHQFGLNLTQFPTIFRWTDLIPATTSTKPPPMSTAEHKPSPMKAKGLMLKSSLPHMPMHGSHKSSDWRSHSMDNSAGAYELSNNGTEDGPSKVNGKKKVGSEPCKFFQKGSCRYGDKCNFQHPAISSNSSQQQSSNSGITFDRSNIASLLPSANTIVSGFIPLNRENQRIDTYLREPTQDEWNKYNSRFQSLKPCNSHHLLGMCTRFNCPYDHSPLEPSARHCLEYVVKSSGCPKGGNCRSLECIKGHLCQKIDCTGQMRGCKMKSELHNVDPKLVHWVAPEEDVAPVRDEYAGAVERSEGRLLW